MYNLARAYRDMDELENALPLFERALSAKKKGLDENHVLPSESELENDIASIQSQIRQRPGSENDGANAFDLRQK
jgi:hypothetical protein